MRRDNRQPNELRETRITPHFVHTAAGSCLIETGGTRVICTASVEESAPAFLKNKHMGWVTAEYAMLPASTGRRKQRDGLKKDGRGVEIQRLIGRSLRGAVDLCALGERTIIVDCDVLEADGGTRTASITGGFVALCLAVEKLMKDGAIRFSPIRRQVAAVSCGIVKGTPLLDLCYAEDSGADADMNAVMTDQGEWMELQCTGENRAFTHVEFETLLSYAREGIQSLMRAQREALTQPVCHLPVWVAATDNPGKIAELQALLGGRYRLVSMREAGFTQAIAETGSTFEQNARIKADTVCRVLGYPALADDSGLTVEALGGAPGVDSALFAGTHGDDKQNTARLLQCMRDKQNRSAAFVCALALARPGEETVITMGECRGEILHEERGTGGFGYDAVFLYQDGRTFAQMDTQTKNSVSHRARAVKAMLERMDI